MKTRKLLAMLVAVAMIVTMLPVVAFAAEYSTYKFVYDAPAVVVKGEDEEVEVNVTFQTDKKGDVGYEAVRFEFEKEGPGDVTFTATDSEGDEYTFTNNGYWGPEDGFELPAEYDATTKWTLYFDNVGRYTITFKLVTVGGEEEVVIAEDSVDIFVVSPGGYYIGYSAAGSTVTANKETVDVDEEVKFTVRFRDSGGLVRNIPVAFYVVSDRDAETITDLTYSGSLEEGALVRTKTDSNGNVTFNITSQVAGKVTISVYKPVESESGEKYDFEDEGYLLIGKETITFESDEDVAVVELAVDEEDLNDDGTATAGKSFDLIATVLDGQDYWVEDKEVTFYEYFMEAGKNNYGSRKKIGTATTNRRGEAKLSVRRDKAGHYAFYATANGKESVPVGDFETVEIQKRDCLVVEVVPASAYRVEAKDDVKYAELDEEVEVKFVYYDRYGSKARVDYDKEVDIEVLDPDGKELKHDKKDGYNVSWDEDKNELVVGFKPKVEGEYKVRAYIPETGIYAETIVNTSEFGEVEKLGLKLYDADDKDKIDNAAVRVFDGEDNKVSEYLVRVYEYDMNGIERRIDASDVYFSTSDAKIATVDKDGVVTLKKDATGVVTITAVHKEYDLTASLDITVSGDPVDLEVEVTVDDLEAEVELKYVDKNGNLAVENEDKEGYRVYTDLEVEDQDDFKNGKAKFVLVAEEYGTYSVRVVTDEGLTETFDVTFTEEEAPVAGKVVLTIGGDIGFVDGAPTELDAPAFIEDGRTFVPVRFLAEAVGAEADWEPKDGPTETVYLTWEDMQIIIDIGEEALTVVKDGEEEVVTFDGAARIVNGRTFLPFRAIGEAIGLEVDYGPKDGPVKWVSYN